MINYFVDAWGQTQDVNIFEQLKHRIRYLDLFQRLTFYKNDFYNKLFIFYGNFYCYNLENSYYYLYLYKLLNYCVYFIFFFK